MLGRKFQNKGKLGWTGTSFFVLEVPLCNLCPSIIYSVPCDQIVQRAYFNFISRGQLGAYFLIDKVFFLSFNRLQGDSLDSLFRCNVKNICIE